MVRYARVSSDLYSRPDYSDTEILREMGIDVSSSLLSEPPRDFKQLRRDRPKEKRSLVMPPVERIDEGEILF